MEENTEHPQLGKLFVDLWRNNKTEELYNVELYGLINETEDASYYNKLIVYRKAGILPMYTFFCRTEKDFYANFTKVEHEKENINVDAAAVVPETKSEEPRE